MTIQVTRAREKLQAFDLRSLFVEELGWNLPPRGLAPVTWDHKGLLVTRTPIAELAGVVVFEVTTADGNIPDEPVRRSIHTDIAQYHLENLLIFLNTERTSSLWYWVKRDGSKSYPRRHTYVQGQPGDLLIGKLSAMFVDISELDANGKLRLVEAISRVRQALDVEPVTRRFFSDFQKLHGALLDAITGVTDERDRRWYASVLLNRLMFVYFLQRRGFLDGGNYRYLQQHLAASQERGLDQYYSEFLQALFFEGFAKPATERSAQAQALIGDIRYLNGGLFLPHQVEQKYGHIVVSDRVFGEILALFEGYDWVLDDSPTGSEREINPAALGYIFEKYINQKAFGAYYTRTEITEYLCEQTIHRLALDRVNATLPPGSKHYETVGDLLLKPSAQICRQLLMQILPDLRLIDPACGSGAFLVAAMRTLIEIYSALVGKAKFAKDSTLDTWLARIEREHPNIDYYIKKQIIVNNLYGVDIMAEAIEIARLRLFLALVAAARTVDDLEPLPNIDFNILPGNSLIGLLRVDEQRADQKAEQQGAQQLGLFDAGKHESYRQIVAEKNRLVASYRNAAETLRSEDLSALRDEIQRHRAEAAELLDEMLLDDFQALGIRYEEATWDAAKGKEGKPKRRALILSDIRALQPFHWGYEFDEVMNERGGFDAIIANPPWEIFKPQAKEFFADHSNLVSKKKMTVQAFEQEQVKLLQDQEILDAWLEYLSRFTHESEFFRNAPQYRNQIAVVNGKKVGTDVNLYKLFIEQCYNLLRDNGHCGIIIPSGIYTDLGAKQLRELLFSQGKIRTLFGLSNERFLFEGVHHSYKICLLIFEKSLKTEFFSAAFRINPREAIAPNQLGAFLNARERHLLLPVDLIRRLSPESISIMELKTPTDIAIAEKMLKYPLLGEQRIDAWNLKLAQEFHMTNDSRLFKTSPGLGRLPLYEGKIIWQFDHQYSEPRYWIDEKDGRKGLLGRVDDTGQSLEYQQYRLGFRSAGENTNERNFIADVIPSNVFCGNSLVLSKNVSNGKLLVFLCAMFNSFVLDYAVRLKISRNMNMFYIYQLPVPRLTESDSRFAPIVERAAKLICTTPEYDELACEVGLGDHHAGVTDPVERAKLQAELDGLVAHIYGLSQDELHHILGAFPLVKQSMKDAVLTAYRAFAPNPDDDQVAALIAAGESDRVEFKVAVAWNAMQGKKDATMRDNVVQGVAAFMNSREGGALIIGVDKHGNVVGIANDIANADTGKPNHDGYELYIRNGMASAIGADLTLLYSITFHTVGNHEICRIAAKPSPKPVYVYGDFYVRDGNSKKKLNAQQAQEYVKWRWPA